MYCEENGKVSSSRTSAPSLWGSYFGTRTFPSWPSRGVVCAEQDTLLDCLNEETVYLSSINNNDRDKYAQFFQKRKHPNVLSLPISWCKLSQYCWFQATNLKLLNIFAKMSTWGSHETGRVGPGQHYQAQARVFLQQQDTFPNQVVKRLLYYHSSSVWQTCHD